PSQPPPGGDAASPASRSPASMAIGRRLRLRPGPAGPVAHAAKRYWRYSDEYLTASTVEAACQWANPILYRMPWGGGIPKTAFMSLTLFSTPTKVGVPGPADSVILPARGARKPP